MSNPNLGPVDICNAALTKLGVSLIVSLSDTSTQGLACNAIYPIARDALLRSHPWNFARVWVNLALLSTTPLQLSIKPDPHYQSEILYTGAYQLPSDCVRVFRAAPFNYNFRIVGSQLYTDAPPQNISTNLYVGSQPGVGLPPITNSSNPNTCGIEYISRDTDVSTYDSMFVDAFVAKLAMELAWPLTASLQLKADLEKEFTEKLTEAWYSDGAEQWNDDLYNNVLTDVRQTIGAPNGSVSW